MRYADCGECEFKLYTKVVKETKRGLRTLSIQYCRIAGKKEDHRMIQTENVDICPLKLKKK